jgi:hypothetical protein
MVSISVLAGRIAFGAGSVAFTALALVPLIGDNQGDRVLGEDARPRVVAPATPVPPPAVEVVTIREVPMDSVILVATEAEADLVRAHDDVEAAMRRATGETEREIMVMVVEVDEDVPGVVRMLEEQNLATIAMGGEQFQVIDLRGAAPMAGAPLAAQ